MDRVAVGAVELCFDLTGPSDAPVVTLISGLGGQLIGWPPAFVDRLVAAGYRVLRFDNRDAGLSTSFDGRGGFDRDAARRQDRSAAAYTLDELADDTAGLLGALGLADAHIVGRSMGGMIAQTVAIRRPDVVRSLCSIMSTTGDPAVGRPTPAALADLTGPVVTDRAAVLEAAVASQRVTGSPAYPAADDDVRREAAAAYDRSFRPDGRARQLMAIMVSGDRTAALAAVTVPTVVIHGTDDPLVTVSGGEATARAIPGATLVTIPGMGHDLPPAVWPTVVDAIVANAAAADIGREAGR